MIKWRSKSRREVREVRKKRKAQKVRKIKNKERKKEKGKKEGGRNRRAIRSKCAFVFGLHDSRLLRPHYGRSFQQFVPIRRN